MFGAPGTVCWIQLSFGINLLFEAVHEGRSCWRGMGGRVYAGVQSVRCQARIQRPLLGG